MKRGVRVTAKDILAQRCPRCRMGRMFRYSIWRGWPGMFEQCPVCDLRFEREPGYFLGAMYISFVLGVLIVAVVAAVIWGITGWRITNATIGALLLFLPLAPAITLFARVLWIYLDQTVDPDRS